MAKILLVEDDSQIIKLYSGMLKDKGHQVSVSETGGSAMRLALDNKPDLILLDIMLPGDMNGFDVLEKLKKSHDLKNIPVFVMTNLDSEEKVAKEIGAVDYIVKAKVDPKEVMQRIEKYIK